MVNPIDGLSDPAQNGGTFKLEVTSPMFDLKQTTSELNAKMTATQFRNAFFPNDWKSVITVERISVDSNGDDSTVSGNPQTGYLFKVTFDKQL